VPLAARENVIPGRPARDTVTAFTCRPSRRKRRIIEPAPKTSTLCEGSSGAAAKRSELTGSSEYSPRGAFSTRPPSPRTTASSLPSSSLEDLTPPRRGQGDAYFLGLLARQKAPTDPPGTRLRYGNTGPFLAGLIIDRISGLSRAEFIARNILEPFGMTRTAFGQDARVLPPRTPGYVRDPDGSYKPRPGGTNRTTLERVSLAQPMRVGEEVAHGDARAVIGELRNVFADVVVQRKLPLPHENQDCGRIELLEDRAGMEPRLRAPRDSILHIRKPVASKMRDGSVADECHPAAGRPGGDPFPREDAIDRCGLPRGERQRLRVG
jgi:hypothetical protein